MVGYRPILKYQVCTSGKAPSKHQSYVHSSWYGSQHGQPELLFIATNLTCPSFYNTKQKSTPKQCITSYWNRNRPCMQSVMTDEVPVAPSYLCSCSQSRWHPQAHPAPPTSGQERGLRRGSGRQQPGRRPSTPVWPDHSHLDSK